MGSSAPKTPLKQAPEPCDKLLRLEPQLRLTGQEEDEMNNLVINIVDHDV